MRRADRLFEIVQILRRSRTPISARRIAEEVEASQRTVYRDIAALMARRVPIVGEPGIGYVLEPGFDMPPLMLTADELDAAVLGVQWVASRGERDLARAAESLLAKIEAILPEPLVVNLLEPATSIAPADPSDNDEDCSAMMRRAIRAGVKVAFSYRDAQGRESERLVWPILLGYRDAGRILAAWCELRQAFRFFRTERMTAARLLDERIPERRALLRARWKAAMDVERARYLAESGGAAPGRSDGAILEGRRGPAQAVRPSRTDDGNSQSPA